jgi:uncharacterized membrane protein YjgN (DUF898 family)
MANEDRAGEERIGPPLTEAGAAGAPGTGASTATAPPPQTLQVAYQGDALDLFVVMIKNVFLTLVTVGIYSPWARAARRRYLWKQVAIDGHRLEFTGTGKELFFGYLKVMGGYLLLVGAPQVVRHQSPGAGIALQVVAGIIIAGLIPLAIYWSRRYLLGRTRWRGIRFGLEGEASEFAKLWIKGGLLTIVTLGFYAPVFANRIYAAIMNHTRYGTARFSYDGPNKQAFKIAIKGWILSMLTFGIYYFWYRAELQRFRMDHTHFDRAVGRMDVTGGLLLKVTLVNLFGNLLSLGIAVPWTMTYTLRVLLSRVSFVGPVDFAQIAQRVAAGDGTGDTLAGALGVELGI